MERLLYEYDYEKPDLTEEFLEHHGILGMKWGVRKGPPYPLGGGLKGWAQRRKKKKLYKKRVKTLKKARKVKAKKAEEVKKDTRSKEELMNSKDLNAIKKNISKFSNAELQSVMDRIDKEQRFSEYVAKQNQASKSKVQRIKDSVVSNAKAGIKSGAESTIRLVAKNATKMALNKFAESMAGEERQELVKKLFKEEKKK